MANSSVEHYGIASTVALEALKALLLVNGGAATALIALTGKTDGGGDYGLSVLLFGCAALLNALTLVVGYFSQLAYANHVFAFENGNADNARIQIMRHVQRQFAAFAILGVSLFFSAGGMITAFKTVHMINSRPVEQAHSPLRRQPQQPAAVTVLQHP